MGSLCGILLLTASAVVPQGRVVPIDGAVTGVVRAAAISESARGFTVAFRFKAAHYIKRPGPWEGLVFANGTGWGDGFRATITPDVNTSLDGFRMGLRVVKADGGAANVSIRQGLGAERWYHVAFVLGGGELKSYLNGALNAETEAGVVR